MAPTDYSSMVNDQLWSTFVSWVVLLTGQPAMTVRELQNQLLELKRNSASDSVVAALLSLQQELSKPRPLFDPYKALAGWNHLSILPGTKLMPALQYNSPPMPSPPRQPAVPKHLVKVGGRQRRYRSGESSTEALASFRLVLA